jgi:polyhydroxyalkanoate synthesis regulator phasin
MTVDDLVSIRRQADDLLEQQMRLQDAVNELLEAREGGGDERSTQMAELEESVRRLEVNLSQVAAAVANLGQRTP